MSKFITDGVEALTFDCYGTLVDWESGILHTLRRLLTSHDLRVRDSEILLAYGEIESSVQGEEYRLYREVLAEVSRRFGDRYGFVPSSPEVSALADGLPDWPVFPDTRRALQRLADRYRLAVVSNIDDDLFAGTRSQIGVDFDVVVTAEQVGSYKPRRAHFDVVLDLLELPVSAVLHVAESLYHDVVPARELGFRTLWVNRSAGPDGGGASPSTRARPDHTVADLASVAQLLCGSAQEPRSY